MWYNTYITYLSTLRVREEISIFFYICGCFGHLLEKFWIIICLSMCYYTLHTNIQGGEINKLIASWSNCSILNTSIQDPPVCNVHSPFSFWNNWRFSICSSFAFVKFVIAALLRHPKHPIEHIQVLGTEYFSFLCVAVHNDGCRQAKHRHVCPFQSWRLRAQSGIWHAREEALDGTC